jgi:hypothetical protein
VEEREARADAVAAALELALAVAEEQGEACAEGLPLRVAKGLE